MNDDYRPRFAFDITDEQKRRADKLIAVHGLRKAIFSTILDDVLDLIEEKGGIAIGILVSGKCKPRDMLPTMYQAKEANDGRS